MFTVSLIDLASDTERTTVFMCYTPQCDMPFTKKAESVYNKSDHLLET